MSEKSWFVYIVKCSDDSLYTGITNNIPKRVKTHNAGKGGNYTRSRTPVVLMYFETVATKGLALRREHQIKMLPKKEKLKLIQQPDAAKLTKVH